MTDPFIRLASMGFSMKLESKVIFSVVVALCCMPILIVVIISQVGLGLISDVLASVDPQTDKVHIHDPQSGETVDVIDTARIWPARGTVTLEFAQSNLPHYIFHTGIDIANRIGTPVWVFMDGRVRHIARESHGYGYHIIIDHNIYLSSVYAHLDILLVEIGDEVIMGQPIGLMGNTGLSSGPHLHFETRIFRIPVNPRIFLKDNPDR